MIYIDKDPTLKTYFRQLGLKASGYYEGEADNWEGPLTRQADEAARLAVLASLKKDVKAGANRTDWRGFVPVDEERLRAALPTALSKELAGAFIQAARDYDLNPLFLVAISKHETAEWTSNAFINRGNAMGISNAKGVVNQASRASSIRNAAYSLNRPGYDYYDHCVTLADVSKVYAPVGAKNDPKQQNSYWPGLVSKYWSEFESKVLG